MKTKPIEALKLIDDTESIVREIEVEAVTKLFASLACKLAFKEGQSSPKIKQLEWEHGLFNTLFSKTLIGDYEIAPMKDGYHMYLYSKNQYYWLKDYVNTIDEAKQFAQTDFEARIKECLIIE